MGDQVTLRWNSHHGAIMSNLHTQFTSQSLVDVTLACEGKYIRAHQLMLSSCSPYFQALLSIDTTKHPIFFLKDVKFTELEGIIEYIYRGEVVVAQADILSFVSVAKALKINGLANVQTETNTTTSNPIIRSDRVGINRDLMAPPPPPTVDVAPPSHMVRTPTISSNVGVPMPFQQQQSHMSLLSSTSARVAPVLDSSSASLIFEDTDTFGTSVMKLEGPIEMSGFAENENATSESGLSESWQMDYADDCEMLDDDYDEELPVRYGNSYGTGAQGGEVFHLSHLHAPKGHPTLIQPMTSPSNVMGQHTTMQNLHQSIGVPSVSAPTAVVPNSTNAVSIITSQNHTQTTNQNVYVATGNQYATANRFNLATSGNFGDSQRQEFNQRGNVEDVQHNESVEIKVRKFSLASTSAAKGQGSCETNPVTIDYCNNGGGQPQTSLRGIEEISGTSARSTRNNGLGVGEDEVLDFPGTYQAKATATTSRQNLPQPDYVRTSHRQCQALNEEEIVEEMQPAEPVEQKVTKYRLVPPSAAAGQENSERTPVVIDCHDTNEVEVPLRNSVEFEGTSGNSSKKFPSGVCGVQGEGSGLSHSTTLRVTYPLISFGRSAHFVPTVYHENRRFNLPTGKNRTKPTTWLCSNNCAVGCNAVLTTDGDKLLGYTVHNDKCRPLPPQNEDVQNERAINDAKEVTGKPPTKNRKMITRTKSASPWAGEPRQHRVSVPKKCPCCQDKPKN